MPRWDCSIDRNASLTLLEYTVQNGSSTFINNKSSLLRVAENAEVNYIILQNHPGEIQVSNTRVELNTASRASCFTFSFDGQLIRNNLTVSLNGPGIDAHLYGLYLLSNATHVDNHTVVDHRQPNSFSNQLYKGIIQDNAKGVFNGKIFVRPQAQKTNAFQSNRNIVLGDQAMVHTKPQLEIWADDVKCSHGCTTGQLDEEALFYLRSRGISKEQAQGMLLHAFAGETLSALKSEPIRDFIEQVITAKLYQIQ